MVLPFPTSIPLANLAEKKDLLFSRESKEGEEGGPTQKERKKREKERLPSERWWWYSLHVQKEREEREGGTREMSIR